MNQKAILNCNKKPKGFSLIEVLISVTILIFVLMIFFSWLATINKKHIDMTISEDLKNDINYSMNTIGDIISNSAKVYPSEDMYNNNDQLYMGLIGVNRAPTRFNCLFRRSGNSENFSILRATTIMEESPEKILSSWNADHANSSDLNDLIRLNYREDANFVFQNSSTYHYNQVYLIDSDGLAGKVFEISSNKILRRNTSIRPYDFYNHPTNRYNYHLVQLNSPIRFNGTRNAPQDIQFVTGSLVYGARTFYTCVTPNNQLVLIDELDPSNARVLMDPTDNNYTISRFEIKYMALANTASINVSDARLYPVDRNLAECVNVVTINLELTPINSNTSIIRENKIFNINKYYILENFNSKKPDACNP